MTAAHPPGTRRFVLLGILAGGLLALVMLGLRPGQLIPADHGLRTFGEFFAAALEPALDYQGTVPEGTRPLLLKVLDAALVTLRFAFTATSFALAAGALLAFFASDTWYPDELPGRRGTLGRILRRRVAPAIHASARLLIACLRSVHELLWALVMLAAFGLTPLAAVLAIVIPYTGTFAKIISELVDESPRAAADALRAGGASPLQVHLVARMPAAVPDITAYVFYRFECAIRSSAVLGFLGIPTLGYYIPPAFEESHYREVWTYLYALIALVVVFDLWSASLRKRLAR
jgi:phosphonate transport system permease protein